MERKKNFTFNPDKTRYLMIKGKKRSKKEGEQPEMKIKKGKIERTNEYRYLGNWIDERGSVER